MNTPTSELQAPRILVVDDMPDNLALMQGLLDDHFEVQVADSGAQALQLLQADPLPDMVLLDIMMPQMDGYEVLRRIRQDPRTANVPVIFLTALAGPQDETLGLQLGAIDYLTKPVRPDEVVQRLQSQVQATSQVRRMEALSEKLSRHLSPQDWQSLFHGDGRDNIRFEQRLVTLVRVESSEASHAVLPLEANFVAEIKWLALRNKGRLDPFSSSCEALALFEDAAQAVQMSTQLQRSAGSLPLRIGVHTGVCDLVTFQCNGEEFRTVIGYECDAVAHVAAAAATGSVLLSPTTYALVQQDIHTQAADCLFTEEFNDSDVALACLTPVSTQATGWAEMNF